MERRLASQGAHPAGPLEDGGGGSTTLPLSGGPTGTSDLSCSFHEGEATSVGFFLAGGLRGPRDPEVRRRHDEVRAAIAEAFGPEERVWDDEPSPVIWITDELEIGVQLFDRVDSSVMLWIHHRELSARAEAAAPDPAAD